MRPTLFALIAAAALAASPALADTCPASPDHSAELNRLMVEIQSAKSEMDARVISNRMWELWADAPDEQAQEMLDRGMRKRSSYDFLGALADFDRLVAYCPAYAEGYNQRAFVNFLRHDFATALGDLDRALALSPRHVAALSGKALTLMGLDRLDEARQALGQAMALNPWLPERGLAEKGQPLAPPGEDI